MANKAKRHTHKYQHLQMNFGKIWACALPDCNHYMPIHMSKMVEGKNSQCWGCNNTMILDEENMKEDRPICDECIYKQREQLNEIQSRQDKKPKLINALSELGLLDEPTDEQDEILRKVFERTK